MIDPGELAKELRIGNRIGVILETIDIEVTADHIKAIYDGDTGYKPIRITEEWLIKLGFEKDRNGYFFKDKDGFSLSLTKEGEYLVYLMDRVVYPNIILRHIHHLQNACFVLTGQELTIQ
jgi:hypothetical protein